MYVRARQVHGSWKTLGLVSLRELMCIVDVLARAVKVSQLGPRLRWVPDLPELTDPRSARTTSKPLTTVGCQWVVLLGFLEVPPQLLHSERMQNSIRWSISLLGICWITGGRAAA